eukprot:2636545-Amphidinium_carterae.1
MLDSGSDEHCCPLDFAKHMKIGVSKRRLVDVQGNPIPHEGVRRVRLQCVDKEQIPVELDVPFQVCAAHKVLLSVGRLVRAGAELRMTSECQELVLNGRSVPIVVMGSSLYIKA